MSIVKDRGYVKFSRLLTTALFRCSTLRLIIQTFDCRPLMHDTPEFILLLTRANFKVVVFPLHLLHPPSPITSHNMFSLARTTLRSCSAPVARTFSSTSHPSEHFLNASAATFEKQVIEGGNTDGDRVVLVDFFAEWCGESHVADLDEN